MPAFPAELQAVQGALTVAYREAWQVVVNEQQRVALGMATNPRLWRQRDRLAEVRTRIEAEMANVDAIAKGWVAREFPRFYQAGATAAAEALNLPFSWTQPHLDALVLLAKDTMDDLLEATTHVTDDTKRFLREVVKREVVTDQLVGRTAKQTAANVARYLQARGVTSVVYKNGARHGLADYADMAVRTKTAVAYNIGTFNQGAEFGVKFYEVFDGPSCGWESHDDPRLANGRIVSAGEAAGTPIAHPRCARSFGPRPDLTTARQAGAAEPTAGGQARPRPEAAGLPLEAAARTRAAVAAAGARRTAAGLVSNPRTPQRVLARRAAMLQRVRLPRAPRVAPPAPGGQPPVVPPEEVVTSQPAWRGEYDQVMARRPDIRGGSTLTDQFGNPTAHSYAQEAWVRELGEVLDREILRRADAIEEQLERSLDLQRLAREVDEAKAAYQAVKVRWDDVASELFGKGWNDLDMAGRRAVVDEGKKRTKERVRLSNVWVDAKSRWQNARDVKALAYRQATEQVLGELRPMGSGGKDSWRWVDQRLKKHGAKAKAAKETLDYASRFYPQEWIDRATQKRSIRTGVIQRGHQADRGSYTEVMLSEGVDVDSALLPGDPRMLSVATHELGHLMETVDDRIRALEHAFHHRRTSDWTKTRELMLPDGTKVQLPEQEATSRIYSNGERGRRDKWAEHYSGKVYEGSYGSTRYWEHFTTGMEGIFTGRFKMLDDADYRSWVLGILAAL